MHQGHDPFLMHTGHGPEAKQNNHNAGDVAGNPCLNKTV